MTSIIKVDQIQTAAGGTPTAGDLGLNVTGSVLQHQFVRPLRAIETGEVSTSRYTSVSNAWVAPTQSGTPHQITFNAKSSTSKVMIEYSGSYYGAGTSGWAGLTRQRLMATDGTYYTWPAWRNSNYSTTQNHNSFHVRKLFDSSTWDGKTFHGELFWHLDSTTSRQAYEDLMLTVTEIAQ